MIFVSQADPFSWAKVHYLILPWSQGLINYGWGYIYNPSFVAAFIDMCSQKLSFTYRKINFPLSE
jgi:hypothetical protein